MGSKANNSAAWTVGAGLMVLALFSIDAASKPEPTDEDQILFECVDTAIKAQQSEGVKADIQGGFTKVQGTDGTIFVGSQFTRAGELAAGFLRGLAHQDGAIYVQHPARGKDGGVMGHTDPYTTTWGSMSIGKERLYPVGLDEMHLPCDAVMVKQKILQERRR